MPDTPAEGIQDDAGDGDEFVIGTYKSKEEVAKGLAEKDATIQRFQSERDKAKAEGAKLTDILEKLTEATTAKAAEPKEDPSAQIEAFVEKAASALEDDPKAGVRMILEAVSGWQGASEKQQAEARDTAIKEIASQLGQSVAEVKRTLVERDPEVLTYGEAAKKLAETAGVDYEANRATLLALAKANAKTDGPARHDLPGGSTATRVVGKEPAEILTDEQKELIGWNKLTAKQQAELKKKWSE